MNNAIKYGKAVLVILLFVASVILLTWDGKPNFNAFLALVCAALGGLFAHKFRIDRA